MGCAVNNKPALSVAACQLLYRIIAYVRRYKHNRDDLPHAASDVMDGLHRNSDPEVIELKRLRLIRSVRCGRIRTWELTDEGCETVSRIPFSPDYAI